MYFYNAYELNIQSDLEIPGFSPIGKQEIDVWIDRQVSSEPLTCDPRKVVVEKIFQGVRFSCPFGVWYEISNGKKIEIIAQSELSGQIELLPLYGFALASVLQQRGFLVVHASAIEIAGHIIVVLGEKAEGKSTLITSLIARGNSLVSDDVTAFSINLPVVRILPGTNSVKLWPDAIKALDIQPLNSLELFPESEKRNLLFNCKSSRMNDGTGITIIVLDWAKNIALKEVLGTEKILRFMRSSYFSRFEEALNEDCKKNIFLQCSAISRNIRMLKLSRPKDLNLLPDTAKLIEMSL